MEIDYILEKLYEKENDTALANEVLGRLTVCLIDPFKTTEIQALGYCSICYIKDVICHEWLSYS